MEAHGHGRCCTFDSKQIWSLLVTLATSNAKCGIMWDYLCGIIGITLTQLGQCLKLFYTYDGAAPFQRLILTGWHGGGLRFHGLSLSEEVPCFPT